LAPGWQHGPRPWFAGAMAENGVRPVGGKLYQTPADEDAQGASTYTPPGAPMQILNSSYAPRATAERNTDSARTDPTPPVGSTVTHRTSGQRGEVVGHTRHGFSGTAVPQVQWAGEDASWPQGVAANALRVEDSHPSDLQERGGRVGSPPSQGAGSDSPASYTGSNGAL
jgi:hypothetical protein